MQTICDRFTMVINLLVSVGIPYQIWVNVHIFKNLVQVFKNCHCTVYVYFPFNSVSHYNLTFCFFRNSRYNLSLKQITWQQKQQKWHKLKDVFNTLIYIASQFIAEIKCFFNILRCYFFYNCMIQLRTQTFFYNCMIQ